MKEKSKLFIDQRAHNSVSTNSVYLANTGLIMRLHKLTVTPYTIQHMSQLFFIRQLLIGPYIILAWNAQSVNLHIALKPFSIC